MSSKSLNIAIGIPRSLPEGPLFHRAPIRQFWSSSRSLTTRDVHTAPVARRPCIDFKRCSIERCIDRRAYRSTGPSQSDRWQPKRSDNSGPLAILLGASGLAVLASTVAGGVNENVATGKDVEDNVHIDAPEEADEAHRYRVTEVAKHDEKSPTRWIIHGTSVYDITDFIEGHPGGKIILRACGGSVDPFWKLFTIHNKQEVWDILNEYYIGEVDERDLKPDGTIDWSVLGPDAGAVDDPFKDDPERDPSLLVHTAKPCNAETPSSLLADFLTPLRLFFVRNHLWTPRIESKDHELEIELSDGDDVVQYTIEDLKQKFKQHTVTVTLQCAGNRRKHMNNAANGKTSGLPWNIGAIGTADFTGVYLRDVLLDSGYDVDEACTACCENEDADRHIILAGVDTYEQSIPLQTALNPSSDVLLAWEMNGEPMPPDHGGPLRAIVPGSVATRSIKWVNRIRTSCDESSSNWHTRDYKCFGPNVRKAADLTQEDWDEAQSIQELPVQSAITNIARTTDSQSPVTVQGFAYSGGGRKIVRVDVSADGGKTFRQADLRQDKAKGSRRWAWTLWDIEWARDELPAEMNTIDFVVKAVDDSHCTQPENMDGIWNFRGLLGNAWHRVSFRDTEA